MAVGVHDILLNMQIMALQSSFQQQSQKVRSLEAALDKICTEVRSFVAEARGLEADSGGPRPKLEYDLQGLEDRHHAAIAKLTSEVCSHPTSLRRPRLGLLSLISLSRTGMSTYCTAQAVTHIAIFEFATLLMIRSGTSN